MSFYFYFFEICWDSYWLSSEIVGDYLIPHTFVTIRRHPQLSIGGHGSSPSLHLDQILKQGQSCPATHILDGVQPVAFLFIYLFIFTKQNNSDRINRTMLHHVSAALWIILCLYYFVTLCLISNLILIYFSCIKNFEQIVSWYI